MIKQLLTASLLSLGAVVPSDAQQVRSANAQKIYSEIEQLRHLTRVLYFAAHPDDENTRLLAWLVNDQHISTAYMSLTRGDGGQNILGSEQGEALGLIRTHELMEARKIDGAEQFFSRAIDFGFSKTYEETFKHWPQYLLTYDAVWVMRKFRPDVVICRFPPNTMAGHGQHAASAIIAANAFKLAGDKNQYTGQLATYPVWKPKRLLFNAYRFGGRNTTSEDQFKLKVGQYEPGMGMGVGELAGISRSVHKSQGAGTPSVPGVQTEYFKLVDGDSLSQSLFDGIDITWNRVGRPDIGGEIDMIAQTYSFRNPERSLPALLSVRKKIEQVKDDFWRKAKLEEVDKLILDCAGFMGELFAEQPQATAGTTLPFTLHLIARSGNVPVTVAGISWPGLDSATSFRLGQDTLMTIEHVITIPADAVLTQPYWLSAPHPEASMFSIPNDSLLGRPESPNNLTATIKLSIAGQQIDVAVPLSYKKLDPLKGDVVEQLRIVPDATVAFTTNLLIAGTDGALSADVRLHAYKNITGATLEVLGTNGVLSRMKGINLPAGTDTLIPVTLKAGTFPAGKDGYISASLTAGGKTYNKSLQLIQYNHLPSLQYFTPPMAKVVRNDWKCTVKRIGYIEGAGDYTLSFLRLAGLDVDVLKESDMTNAAKLRKYDAIVTGVRSVNVEKRMAYWLPVLMEYVHNGGTLLMQYNNTQDMSTTKMGPYPFTIASELRVTEENAKMTITDPAARMLTYPNKIEDADFDNWVQERGLYFASSWDDHYTTPFEAHDTGEQPLKGGTLYTKYGSGNYIYTSLSFFRQLPAGNKGAMKLLMNMLSIGK